MTIFPSIRPAAQKIDEIDESADSSHSNFRVRHIEPIRESIVHLHRDRNINGLEMNMHKIILVAAGLAAAAGVSGCARETTRDGLRGAGIGAVGGAVAGAVIPGLGVGEGALIGAAGGAVVGAATSEGDRKWQRDRRGREYYIDRNGRRVYRDR